jgi:hypothetical protein
MKWGLRAFLKSFFYEIAMARCSTSSNLEALGLVLEQDFIRIVGRGHGGNFWSTNNLILARESLAMTLNFMTGLKV